MVEPNAKIAEADMSDPAQGAPEQETPPPWKIKRPYPQTVEASLETRREFAKHNQRMAHGTQSVVLVASASIPVATTLGAPGAVIGGLGAIVTVLASMNTQFRWHENWTRDSQVINGIQSELVLYDSKIPPYDDDDERAGGRLAIRVQDLVSTDAAAWWERERQLDDGAAAATQTNRDAG
jgi:hypothetical protein